MADTSRAQGIEPADAKRWIAECDTFVTPSGHRIAYRRRGTGPTVLLLHGFPTWSYDYAEVAGDIEQDHEVLTFDFLGYGVSDKPNPYHYSVTESADIVEQLLRHLGVQEVDLVFHDYGSIVGQELLDRRLRRELTFGIRSVTIFNCGLVYDAYRPTRLQRILIKPVLGRLVASRVTQERVRTGLNSIRGDVKLTDPEFANLWYGISRNDGHKLAHLHIRYNAERNRHHERWEAATRAWDGPLHLIWGLQDPVSGKHVLEIARKLLPSAKITELPAAGHYPMAEMPRESSAAIRSGINS